MKAKHLHHLIVFVQTSLVFARTYPNYGYYNPFPPKNQVLYNFAPLSDTTQGEHNVYNDESSSLTNNEVYGRRKGGNNNRNRYNSYVTTKDTNNSDRKHKNSRLSKDRGTRDLTWRKFDVFLRGDAEPSCAE